MRMLDSLKIQLTFIHLQEMIMPIETWNGLITGTAPSAKLSMQSRIKLTLIMTAKLEEYHKISCI